MPHRTEPGSIRELRSSLPRPFIKICGVTRAEDVQAVASSRATAIGFNFVAGSPRCITANQAQELCQSAHELGLCTVAVVRNLEEQSISELLSTIEIDFIQLHGEESPSIRHACRGLGIIKALSWSGRAEEQQLASAWKAIYASTTDSASAELQAFLVDAYDPVLGGGTGRRARWDLLQPRPPVLEQVPLILAGGLTPENVSDAIGKTRCCGVDTASGVEDSPGIKSAEKIHRFAARAAEALTR